MNSKKVIVVGAGIVGLSTAYFLHKRGIEVTVIDNTDGSDNCSHGNAGYVSPSHIIPLASPGIISQGIKWMINPESPFYIKPRLNADLIRWGLLFKKASTKTRVDAAIPVLNQLTLLSKKYYEQILGDESIEAGYSNEGLLMLCKTESTLHHEIEVADIGKNIGIETSILTREESEKLEPGLEMDIAGAVLFKCDAWMTPGVFMKEFKKRLINKGIKIQHNTTLTGAKIEKNKIVALETNMGDLVADEYVLATGSWSPILAKKLGVSIPLQAGKGYSFMIKDPVVKPNLPSILVEARVATTPMLDGLRFAGTMEIAGTQLDINPIRVRGIVNSISKYLPQFKDQDFSQIKPWAGLRPCTPDGLPYIGRTSKYSNLVIGTGHAMLGFTLGPVTGQLLSQEILNEKADFASPLLAVDRYA
uniref:NAD(P)/FAD-dependent oxidoreductase n=1 Tax=Roseivirga sp. TaxID=1964215 RepID=UPI0040471EBC